MTDEERQKEDRKRKREWLLLLLITLIRNAREDLTGWVGAYAAGTLTARDFGDKTLTLIRDGHSHAVYIGRQAGGNSAPFGRDDQEYGAAIALTQSMYLQGFIHDLEQGRYLKPASDEPDAEKVLDVAEVTRRALMYADRIAGTANEAWRHTLPVDTLLWWKDIKDSAECKPGTPGFLTSCPEMADSSPHKAGEAITDPARGDTPCLDRCRCGWETEDGEESFDLRRVLG